MSGELKRCPHCYGVAGVRHARFWTVVCGECRAMTAICDSREQAIARWNLRVPLAQLQLEAAG